MVRAGFQRDVGGGSFQAVALRLRISQGHDFCVRATGALGVASGQCMPRAVGDDATHSWVGVGQEKRFVRNVECFKQWRTFACSRTVDHLAQHWAAVKLVPVTVLAPVLVNAMFPHLSSV